MMDGYAHPMASFFHVFFKGAALTVYILCEWFSSSFVLNFVSCVLLIAFDFWTVKNITGRLLVGLRWWNEIREDGTSVWRFESLDAEAMKHINAADSRIFWWGLYVTPFLWLLMGLIAILKLNFDYLLIVAVAFILTSANIVGYTKCSKEAKIRLTDLARASITSGITSAFNRLSGGQ
eukprot:jgi/Mesvir1/11685/Mv00077-RA.1